MLLHHCANLFSGRRLSMRFVEKEAYSWVNREIYTLEQAEKYIAQYRSRNEETNRIAAIFGIRGRELTAAEKKYIGAWIEMGFEDSALNEAYERTMLNAGKFTWNLTGENGGLNDPDDYRNKTPEEILKDLFER